MIGCGSIANQNFFSLDYGVDPSTCFKKKVHQVKVKYGSNQLAKIGAKDELSYIASLSIANT